MTSSSGVQAALDRLQAEREATWPADQVAAHRELRDRLHHAADPSGFIGVGDVFPRVALRTPDGGELDLDGLAATGPVVVLLFRFESCPACNAALGAYQRTLAGEVARRGAHLVAISPQVPERLTGIIERQDLSFTVASCAGTDLLEQLGVGFAPDEDEREAARSAGADLGELLGTGDWTLPYPSTLVVDRSRVVSFVDVHPDWMVRTESAVVLEVLDALSEEERLVV